MSALADLEDLLTRQLQAITSGEYEQASAIADEAARLAQQCELQRLSAWTEQIQRIAELQQSIMLTAADQKAKLQDDLRALSSKRRIVSAYRRST